MKTYDIKTLKGKVNGILSTLVKEDNVDRSLGNILFILGFKQANGYYYKEGSVDIVKAAKNYIKSGKYQGGEEGNVDFINDSYAYIDKVEDIDELNQLVNQASVNNEN